jgi:hypothetical protein
VVYLRVSVDLASSVMLAEQLCRRVPGVLEVINDIRSRMAGAEKPGELAPALPLEPRRRAAGAHLGRHGRRSGQ